MALKNLAKQKHRKALIYKESPPESVGFRGFLIWSGIRESNPPILLGKQVFYQ